MADLKITKKPHPAGSLAGRVLIVSVLFLAIPLFVESLFLYFQEYAQESGEVEQALRILANERGALIEERIGSRWDILRTVSGDVQRHAKQWNIEPYEGATKLPEFFAVANRKRNALLVGRKEPSGRAWAIPIPFSQLVEQLSQEKDSPYPIRMALLSSRGEILSENMKARASGEALLSVELPIEGTQIRLQITIPRDLIGALQKTHYVYRIALLIFFVGVIGGGAVYLLTRRIAKPLNALCQTMIRVSEGGVHARYTPDRMGFEINQLGKQFNETLDALLLQQQEAEKQRIARERLAEELKIGHEIQTSLLPLHMPDLPDLDIAGLFLPAMEVSGDFYDLVQLENGSLLLVMADTAGKGISACLYSLGLRSVIRSLATTTSDLSTIVMKANDLFWLDARNTGMFVTLWMGIYDPAKRTLIYCTQGHPPGLLRRCNQIEELWTGGIALGAQQFDAIPLSEVTLERGDLLFLYTDGVIEAHDPDRHLYGKKRLHEFLHQEKMESSQQFAHRLGQEIVQFSGSAPQHDDIAMLVFRLLG